ncbi:MAG: 3-oxoacyl-ACP synthase, partial [Micrococcaceae bacterium]|nr:3-oxoacyl-ACP synthase [Micrococcaceae bacterium]MDN6202868.1 3-oxoacyl-ACP synthase [Micrococcaceae bacterium]
MGVGAARGDVVVTNEDVCQWIDSSDEWIQKRTGIITRRRADADTSLVDLAETASRQALENAGIEGSQLGGVIISTVTSP